MLATCIREYRAAWITPVRVYPGHVEDVVVDLRDRDRNRQPGKLESIAVAVHVGQCASHPTGAVTAIDPHGAGILDDDDVRFERLE